MKHRQSERSLGLLYHDNGKGGSSGRRGPVRELLHEKGFSKRKDYSGLDVDGVMEVEMSWIALRYILENKHLSKGNHVQSFLLWLKPH